MGQGNILEKPPDQVQDADLELERWGHWSLNVRLAKCNMQTPAAGNIQRLVLTGSQFLNQDRENCSPRAKDPPCWHIDSYAQLFIFPLFHQYLPMYW